jgi:hypothetical protein
MKSNHTFGTNLEKFIEIHNTILVQVHVGNDALHIFVGNASTLLSQVFIQIFETDNAVFIAVESAEFFSKSNNFVRAKVGATGCRVQPHGKQKVISYRFDEKAQLDVRIVPASNSFF